MHNNVYCAFCGVILERDPINPDTWDQRNPRPWYRKVRGLTTTDTPDRATLTGVGLIYNYDILDAPADSNLSYAETEVASWGSWELSNYRWHAWAFGVHDSCWQILLLRLSHLDVRAIVPAVYRQLLCVPCIGGSSFDWGHDYDGAARTHKLRLLNRFRPRPLPADETSPLYADPCSSPPLDAFEIVAPAPCTAAQYLQSTSRQSFGSLSPELIYEILPYLSCKEVAILRLVNRNLAVTAAWNRLPQSYWQSRFQRGGEADFIFANLTDRRDWRGLFFAVRAMLQDGRNLCLVNRKRVRELIEPIALVVEQDSASRPSLYGTAVHGLPGDQARVQLPCSQGANNPPLLLENTNKLTGDLSYSTTKYPHWRGCRVLHRRAQRLPYPSQYYRGKIAISTRQIGAMTFVSGIGIFPSCRGEYAAVIVGFHDPFAAQWIGMPPSAAIDHIHVAFSSQGLTGIMFTFTNGTVTPWVGVSKGSGVAQGSLAATGDSTPSYLLAGLDVSGHRDCLQRCTDVLTTLV